MTNFFVSSGCSHVVSEYLRLNYFFIDICQAQVSLASELASLVAVKSWCHIWSNRCLPVCCLLNSFSKSARESCQVSTCEARGYEALCHSSITSNNESTSYLSMVPHTPLQRVKLVGEDTHFPSPRLRGFRTSILSLTAVGSFIELKGQKEECDTKE